MRIFVLSFLLCCLAVAQKTENTIDRESAVLYNPVFPRVFEVDLTDKTENAIQLRATIYLNMAAWNAWCNYHPTAADIFGRTRFKRPPAEHTRENKNTAVLLSLFRILEASPQSFGGSAGIPLFRELLRERGFDPDDRSTDITTPVGIGNREGFDTARLMATDGWNAQGDLTSSQKNYAQPFADYTGYQPKNTPWKLKFPFRWQPLLENNGLGFFFHQEHVAPYAGSTIAFTMTRDELNRREVKSPYKNRSATVEEALQSDINTLKKQARQVFRTSARLTERQGILAEYFDNLGESFRDRKTRLAVPAITTTLRFFHLGPAFDWNMDEDMIYGMGHFVAIMDAMVTLWKEKIRIDAVRPTSQTMRFLFGDRKFKVWGGPGKSPVKIPAGEWQPYIRTRPLSEFPSGMSCLCTAAVEHALIHTNQKDDLPFTFTIPKGTSKYYPGQIPSKDTKITVKRLSDWGKLCRESRLWGGVNFEPAVTAGEELCSGFGKSAKDFMDKLVAGELDPKWMTWLPKDVERFWEED